MLIRQTKTRKADHIRIVLAHDVQAKQVTTGFENVSFIHRALPEVNRDEVELATTMLGHKFAAPVIVGAITGGTSTASRINATIAEVVEKLGLGMGVGSQRAAIEQKALSKTFSIARKKAPNAFLIANIGAVQLVNGFGVKEVRKALEMIDADAIALHLNPLQEAAQPEGQTAFNGVLSKIMEVANQVDKPVIVKETGAGIGAEDARRLEDAGAACIDVSGAGGTSWAAVESYRSKEMSKELTRKLGNVFWDWGIPTAQSLVEVTQTVNIPVIASGGLRDGVDAAKSLSLGAGLVSLSQPILRSAITGVTATENALLLMMEELKNAMFLVGAKSVEGLKKVPLLITGVTAERLALRKFDVQHYAVRGA